MEKKIPDGVRSFYDIFQVKPEDIDELNHVNNVVYLQWVNDISGKHWRLLSNKDIDDKYFWVALRHEIDYLHPAFLNDQISIYTWVGKTGGVRSVRHVHIYRDETLLVKAQTIWGLIDKRTGKITRIGSDVMELLQ